jgi:hypothetical protein
MAPFYSAYEAKTGEEFPTGDALPPSLDRYEPTGEPWKESDLATRFPRMCKRFGSC